MPRIAALAASWRLESLRRRRMSSHDVTADILEHCASELDAELADASDADEELTVQQYAELHGKSVSTVRRWCQTGAISTTPHGREYRIRRGEPCPSFRAAA